MPRKDALSSNEAHAVLLRGKLPESEKKLKAGLFEYSEKYVTKRIFAKSFQHYW